MLSLQACHALFFTRAWVAHKALTDSIAAILTADGWRRARYNRRTAGAGPPSIAKGAPHDCTD
ncbi:MAG: hypothetical protein RR326_14700, partial [Stenotrophomonas sp.]